MPSKPHPPLTWPGQAVLLAGATGLVGRELMHQLVDAGAKPLLLTRRPLPSGHAPATCTVLQVATLAQPGPLPPVTTACIALGTTIAQAGSQQAFKAVDLDAVVAVARAARAAGATRLAVVSALGANASATVFYNRVKGEAEAALATLGYQHLVLARPSLLAGPRETLGQPTRHGEVWTLRLTRPFAGLIPAAWRPIEAHVVARAMLRALAEPDGRAVRVIESAELQSLGAP